MGFKAKLQQLEQVKIEFDDSKSNEGQQNMPSNLNSKRNRGIVTQQPKRTNFLGFVSAETEENKDNRSLMYSKKIFRPTSNSGNDSDTGPTLINGQLNLQNMAKKHQTDKESDAKKRMLQKMNQARYQKPNTSTEATENGPGGVRRSKVNVVNKPADAKPDEKPSRNSKVSTNLGISADNTTQMRNTKDLVTSLKKVCNNTELKSVTTYLTMLKGKKSGTDDVTPILN